MDYSSTHGLCPRYMQGDSDAAGFEQALVDRLALLPQKGEAGQSLRDLIREEIADYRQCLLGAALHYVTVYSGKQVASGLSDHRWVIDDRIEAWIEKVLNENLPHIDQYFSDEDLEDYIDEAVSSRAKVLLEENTRLRQTEYTKGYKAGAAYAVERAIESGEVIRWQTELPGRRKRVIND